MPGLAVINAVRFQKTFIKPQMILRFSSLLSDVNKCRPAPPALSNWYFSSITQSTQIAKPITTGVTSEVNMGTDFHLKEIETEEKRLFLCWQNKKQISYLSTAPRGTREAQNGSKLLNKYSKCQAILHTCTHSWWGFHFSPR